MSAKRVATVLIIEDNLGDLLLIKDCLSKRAPGCQYLVASDGEEAMKLLKSIQAGYASPPDFILLDFNLPKVDGRTLLEAIKQDELMRQIPVTVFSSSSAPVDVKAAFTRHANSYVVKPFGLDDFENCLGRIYEYWTKISVSPFAV